MSLLKNEFSNLKIFLQGVMPILFSIFFLLILAFILI